MVFSVFDSDMTCVKVCFVWILCLPINITKQCDSQGTCTVHAGETPTMCAIIILYNSMMLRSTKSTQQNYTAHSQRNLMVEKTNFRLSIFFKLFWMDYKHLCNGLQAFMHLITPVHSSASSLAHNWRLWQHKHTS